MNLGTFRCVLPYDVQIFAELTKHQPAQLRGERIREIRGVYEHRESANSLATTLDLLKRSKEELEKGGIRIPFPQRDVQVHRHALDATPE